MRAHAIAAAAALIATAACGGEARQQSVSTTDARPSVEAATTGAVVAQTELGPLPSPATVAELQRRILAMPDALRGARRAPGSPERIRYAGDAGDFGIDVSDAEDLYPDVRTTAEVFPRLGQQLSDPQGCGQPPSYCVRGGSEGQSAVIWGHDDSPMVFVAHAPDEATLTELLAAWRSG